MALLELLDISKAYNHEPAVDHVSLELDEGNILCLLGPSGCGKTTLLRIIAGLERQDTGIVRFDGMDMAAVAPHLRNFGMMFQEFALFPHRNVFRNVSFGLEMQNQSRADIFRRTEEMLKLVGLEGYSHRNVGDLSGGERQRVALARTLAPRPRLILLDEPLGSLDRALRERLMLDLKEILKRVGVTTVFVTHDQTEAYAIADLIAVIREGKIEQIDPPETLYRHPANAAIARFLGFHNLLEGIVEHDGFVGTEIGVLPLSPPDFSRSQRVTVLIAGDGVRISSKGEALPGMGPLVRAVVKTCLFKGKIYHLEVEIESGKKLFFELPNDSEPPAAGDEVILVLNPSDMLLLPENGG
ncbi:MAG: ABC transporter ATP-binding protein [Desulfomonilia bacterium]